MSTSAAPATDHAAILAAVDRDGFAILRGAIAPRVVADVRLALERLCDERVARFVADGRLDRGDHAGAFESRLIGVAARCRDAAPAFFREELHVPELFPLLACPELVDLAERVVGPEVRLYPNYMARPKLPDDHRMLIAWHQDAGYTANFRAGGVPAESLRTLNVWTPLVPARRANGCMQAIPGSHRLGLLPHEAFQDLHLTVADATLAQHLARAVDLEVDPGDAIVFHNLLLHQGLPNTSGTIRWSVDWRFQDATQPTLRPQHGHLLRSRLRPRDVIASAQAWAASRFG